MIDVDKVNIFTSTGIKLINHPEAIRLFKEEKRATPISLQISLTSKCNLNCDFCSNINRKKDIELDYEETLELISNLKKIGLKTVEVSGGGDATLYRRINSFIEDVYSMGLKIGMITNGVLLKDRVKQENLDKLTWLRISINCLEYVDEIDIPNIKGTLGFSYVWNERTNIDIINKIRDYAKRYKVSYIRVVPNCLSTIEEQKKKNRFLSKLVSFWGEPFFYQVKDFNKPKECYWCYFKPFLNENGWIYPCSSVVLNSSSDRTFHEKYRFFHMKDFHKVYEKEVKPFNTKNCDHCVFYNQNKVLYDLINPNGMEDFI